LRAGETLRKSAAGRRRLTRKGDAMSSKSVWVRVVAGGLGLALGVGLAPPAADAAPGWRMIDLGAGDDSYAAAVNDLGHVAVNGRQRAFLWRGGKLTDLGHLGGGVAVVNDVNNRDEAVGWSSTADNEQHAFLWRDGRMRDLGTLPGGHVASAEAINDRGEVVGSGVTADSGEHAFRWRRGVFTDLGGNPINDVSRAHDVNDAGQIAGDWGDRLDGEGASQAVRWWRDQRLPLFPETETAVATKINNRGHILGSFYGDGSYDSGYLWHGGGFTAVKPPAGATTFVVQGLNDRDQVVGLTVDAGGVLDAVLWQRGQTQRLPNAGPVGAAADINERGQIVGTSTVREGATDGRAVMWVR
jgi:probable HAF family extracellular repeat protein